MERFYLDHPGEAEPDLDTEEMQLVQNKGIEHELNFLAALKNAGRGVTDFGSQKEHLQATLSAMRRGDEIIYQGYLVRDEFAGYSDFLVREDSPSSLGAWSYEPWDTKFARHPKPYFLVQLCCYAEMLEAVQGVRPRHLRVVLGAKTDAGPEPAPFRTDDFFFYYRALKEAFLEQQRAFDPAQQPEINPFADLGRWAGYAERILEERDDLALVANIRSSQRRKLLETGIQTVAALAAADGIHVPRFNDATLDQLRRQAKLQVSSRGKDKPDFELLPADGAEGPLGLSLLPPAPDASRPQVPRAFSKQAIRARHAAPPRWRHIAGDCRHHGLAKTHRQGLHQHPCQEDRDRDHQHPARKRPGAGLRSREVASQQGSRRGAILAALAVLGGSMASVRVGVYKHCGWGPFAPTDVSGVYRDRSDSG